ncbi:MAG: tRNA (N6-threonylcarbamoyladenosine(37)-N6)-methyltransferase TrmO [Paludibacteraceae bacterium]|nr:tRNA (N6-threonylcarbamoyladenosine(37)-N6)-methyltransferase TrmO [Paludibacteraceae bacterium]
MFITPIGHIENLFTEKFGIPRQSGLVGVVSRIVLAEDYRHPSVYKGLEDYSHVWLIWEFSANKEVPFSPTVRPPRLGGNTRMGVFATRSPYRPNKMGLSCVKIEKIELNTPQGPVLWVSGADLMNGTPILDIKPYLPHSDSIPEAKGGFSTQVAWQTLQVEIPDALLAQIPQEHRQNIIQLLSQDPRPAYQNNPTKVYGVTYAHLNIRFTVTNGKLIVVEIK